MNCNA